MLPFLIDPSAAEPIYRQIIGQVQRLAASGQLQEGDLLPSVRAVAERHAINPMTVSKAYGLLEQEGLLVRQRGRGMQVARTPAVATELLVPAIDELIAHANQLGLSREQVTDLFYQRWLPKSRGK